MKNIIKPRRVVRAEHHQDPPRRAGAPPLKRVLLFCNCSAQGSVYPCGGSATGQTPVASLDVSSSAAASLEHCSADGVRSFGVCSLNQSCWWIRTSSGGCEIVAYPQRRSPGHLQRVATLLSWWRPRILNCHLIDLIV